MSPDPGRPLPPPFVPLALMGLSLLVAVINIAAAYAGAGGVRAVTAWLYLPPLMLALALATGLRTARSRWWLAGLVLCWLGDGLGGQGFLVLLGCFLLGHLAYLVALWPTRRRSWLRGPGVSLHLALLALGLVLVVPAADGLEAPVVGYGLVLTLMAVLATAAGWPGLLGGLLFMVSDLSLGWLLFAVQPSEATQALVVIGTYVPAQVLLLLAHLRLLRTEPTAPSAASSPSALTS